MHSRLLIYVVEDSTFSRAVILKKLRRSLHCQAIGFSTAEECWERTRRKRPDVLLVDCELGTKEGMTSTDLMTNVRKSKSEVSIIAYSSTGSVQLASKCFDAGANDFIERSEDFMNDLTYACEVEKRVKVHTEKTHEIKKIKRRVSVSSLTFLAALCTLDYFQEWDMMDMWLSLSLGIIALFFLLNQLLRSHEPERKMDREF